MIKKIVTILIIFSISSSYFYACGGSKKNDDSGLSEEEKRQQQELDEIEALLGITPEESGVKKDQKSKDEEQLGLLSSEELPNQDQTTEDTKKASDLEKELKSLKSKMNEKDLIISDLKSQISLQSEQIDQLHTQRPASSSFSFSEGIGDVTPEEYKYRYQEAFELFQAREYRSALQLFESLLASNANTNLSDNAQYWIGESHYALRQFDKAIIDFEKVFTFPNSNKNDAAQFKLGLCYTRKGDKEKAREEFQRLIDLYPKSEFVSRAQNHLGKL